MGYGEDADAALGAAGFADEVVAAALVGVGYGYVYDLDETINHSYENSIVQSITDGPPNLSGGTSRYKKMKFHVKRWLIHMFHLNPVIARSHRLEVMVKHYVSRICFSRRD
jgi:hypothetical protein